MATRNGSYQSNARIEWYYSVGSVNQSTSSVTVTVRAYLRMQGGYSINGNWPVKWWGSWGTSSDTQNMVLGGGQRKQIRSWSQKVTLTDSSQARSLAIRAQHYWGSTQDTLNFSVPARYARTPSNVQVNRVSDSNIRVAWTRNSTYSSVVVQRRVNEGSWRTAGVAQGNAQNITLTDGRVNRRYQYRVQGRGGSGNSGYSAPSTYVHTTPVAPLGIAAERAGSGISVSVDNTTPWATRFDVEDSVSGIVATNQWLSALPYLHTDPNPAQPHRYRVRMRVYSGGVAASWLVGPWSTWSNTVQLIQQPTAPTNLSPNGTIVDLSKNVTFAWRHNSVDSSAQSSAELRYRKTGTTSWTTRTITGSTQQRAEILSALGAGGVQWQVRTKGAHPDFSPWSALASLTLINAPTVAILEPQSPHRSITVTPEWNYAQEQNRPQSSWQVELRNIDTGALVEARSGSGNVSSVRLNARLEPDTNYLVRVRAATGSIYSDWAEMPFVTEFVPPREPIIEGEWNEESGSYGLTIEDADCTDAAILHQNLVTNPAMESTSGTVVVRRNHVSNPIGPGAPTSGSAGWRSSSGDTGEFIVDDGMPAHETVQGEADTGLYVDPDQNFTASVGDTIRLSIDVKTNSQALADDMRLRIYAYSGAANDSPAAAVTPIPVNEWTRLSRSGVVTAAPEGGFFRLLVWPSVSADSGDYIRVRRAVVEIGTGLLPDTDFFDGYTHPDPDLTALWTGEPHASASVLTGLGVADLSRGAANWTSEPYQITEPDGSKAARFITSTASLIGVPVSNVSTPVGVTRTVLFQVRPSVDIVGRPRVGNSADANYETIPAGQWTTLRTTGTSASSSVSQTGLLVSANTPGNFIDIRYAMLTEGEYDGPYHDGDDEGWEWTGTPHGSSSTQVERPASTSVVIERSIDDGDTWEHVTEASFGDCSLSVSDFEGLSCGTTLYRVTSSAATGASIDVVHEGLADSEAIWLGTGEGFSQTARLSLHDGIGIRRGRQRSLEQYQGRSLGVAYMSENMHRTISVQGTVPDEDRLRCPSATRDELDDVILAPYPVHLHRDMHGNRVYGIVPEVDNDREWLMRHEDCGEHQGMCRQGLWSFGYSLDETESR